MSSTLVSEVDLPNHKQEKPHMATYKELQEQRDAIEAQMQAMLQQEKEEALVMIRQKVEELGLTPDEVFGKQRKKAEKKPVAIKYSNPETGQTWSGRGKAPAWCNTDRLKKKFLVATE